MSVQDNFQIVQDGYAALGRGGIPGLLASFAEDIELVIPGEGLLQEHWVMAFTVWNRKVMNVRKYTDTLAPARAFEMAALTNSRA